MILKQLDVELAEVNLKLGLINDIFSNPVLEYEHYDTVSIDKTIELAKSLRDKISKLNIKK